jgi:hypothetical protein
MVIYGGEGHLWETRQRRNAKSCAGFVSLFQRSSMDIYDIYGADAQGRLRAGILQIA